MGQGWLDLLEEDLGIIVVGCMPRRYQPSLFLLIIFSKNTGQTREQTVFQTWQLHLQGLGSYGERALDPLQTFGPGKGLPSGRFVSQMWSF
jgi:hypothetical protein